MAAMVQIVRHHRESVDSTRVWAREFETPDLGQMILLTADYQSAGRGQYGRGWLAPPGVNLLMTLIRRGEILQDPLRPLTRATKGVLESSGLEVHFKEPNDLQIGGKKVAGLIADTRPEEESLRTVLSLGLNVNMSGADLAQIDQPATSLLVETGRAWELDQLLDQIVESYSSGITTSSG